MQDPKPTDYAGIEFRSRLEARWAVLLDYNPLVTDWDYEPRTFRDRKTGWKYTPDFLFHCGVNWHGWIEVKPSMPTEKYLLFLTRFLPLLNAPLYLCVGTFYDKEPLPQLAKVERGKPLQLRPLDQVHILPIPQEAIDAAFKYRFDLEDQGRPTFRTGGSSRELRANMDRSIQDASRQKRQKRKRR